jgi:hypothetical protein
MGKYYSQALRKPSLSAAVLFTSSRIFDGSEAFGRNDAAAVFGSGKQQFWNIKLIYRDYS